jgi:hypothetical protein
VQHAAWQKPHEKKEPITYLIFKVMFDWVQSLLASNPIAFCNLLAVVFDWLHLGLHTGLHLGEYGQSKVPSGQLFATIPYSIDAGEWAGMPLAFIISDFMFFEPQIRIQQTLSDAAFNCITNQDPTDPK